MGVERFDLLLRDATSGATIKREWSKAELLRSVAWLKRMNARGSNVYIRPSGEHGFALLGSLTAEKLTSMSNKGFAPAVSLEATRNEFQAWVRLSDQPLPESIRHLAGARLASAFSGTEDTQVRDGYGWLAGFVNHECFSKGGRSRKYVVARAGSAELSSQASAHVAHFVTALAKIATERESLARSPRLLALPRAHGRKL